MSERFLNYKLTLETLGPLFIGSGEEIGKSEYVTNGNTLYVFDMKKMFAGLTKYHQETKYANSVLSNTKFSLGYFFRENRIFPERYKTWAKYALIIPENVEIKNNILATIKDAYSCPYIPGSSMKGAIRNTILNAVLLDGKRANYSRSIENSIHHELKSDKKEYLKSYSNIIDTDLFNTLDKPDTKKSDAVNSVFQGLTISDSEPLSTDCLILCPKIDVLPQNKGKNGLKNVVRECIKPGTKITFSLGIDTAVFPYGVKQILECIDKTYYNINSKFLSSFKGIPAAQGQHKIFLGGGVGYVSKTCVYSLFDTKNKTVENAGIILNKVDSYKKDKHGEKIGNHLNDLQNYGVAPHMRKCTKIDDRFFDIGLCSIELTEI